MLRFVFLGVVKRDGWFVGASFPIWEKKCELWVAQVS